MISESQAPSLDKKRRGGGPKTVTGKRASSRNARRHGLAATTHRHHVCSSETQRLARILCDNDDAPQLVAVAKTIVENEMEMHAIREEELAVVKRLREPTAVALSKGDNGFELGIACSMAAWLGHREIEARAPHLLEKYKDQLPKRPDDWPDDLPWEWQGTLVPDDLKTVLEDGEAEEETARAMAMAERHLKKQERDDFAAFEGALLDLVRLDRYYRRAWSRQKRAIRNFANLKYLRRRESGSA
jgi:hypothetical protein